MSKLTTSETDWDAIPDEDVIVYIAPREQAFQRAIEAWKNVSECDADDEAALSKALDARNKALDVLTIVHLAERMKIRTKIFV